MKDFLEKYKTYLPFLLLLIYTYGYAYYKTYFFLLGINIEYYVSLSDLIFVSINFLIFLGILVFLTEIILHGIISRILFFFYAFQNRHEIKKYATKKEFREKLINVKIEAAYNSTSIIVIALSIIPLVMFTDKLQFYIYSIFSTLLIIKIFFFAAKTNENKNDTIEEKSSLFNFLSIFLVTLLLLFTIISGYRDFNSLKNSTETNTFQKISFLYNQKYYSTLTQRNLIFAGETSQYLFIYDKSIKTTLIFSKGKIDELSFIDPLSLTGQDQSNMNKIQKFILEFLESQNK